MKTKFAVWLMLISLVLFITACGKNIPAISPDMLQAKQSVLVISKPGLNEQAAAALQKMLFDWRDSRHIAYEWIHDAAAIESAQADKMKTTPYDYIIVIGNQLTRQAAEYAAGITNKKWILLDDEISPRPVAASGDHIVWKQTGDDFMEKQWQEWVKQQQVIGKRIEWVTVSSNPIPSVWAPSEEAEYISLADAEGWYSQFQFQVKQHAPDWIAVYAPVEAAYLQRMKSLQVPVMNMAVTSVQIQWEALTATLLDLLQKQWTPGIQNYNQQEITVIKQ